MAIRIIADELTFALDSHEPMMQNYLDLQTGEVVPLIDEMIHGESNDEITQAIEDDPGRFRRIDPVPSWQGWQWMEEFAENVADSGLRDRLLDAITGKGAFGRFGALLRYHEDHRQAWFRFQNQRLMDYARIWLRDEGIEAELVERVTEPSGGTDRS